MYSSQGIETAFLERHPDIFASVDISPIGKRLTPATVELARGASAVCAFVNDVLDRGVLETLQSFGIKLILMRCAGYNVRVARRGQIKYAPISLAFWQQRNRHDSSFCV
jgi:lactate dehydrogenase-like 2-hydroxyacid dehydrogenase